jgi:hypothetical protein
MDEKGGKGEHPDSVGMAADTAAPGSLQDLLTYIGQHRSAEERYPELADADYFRKVWARTRSAQLLRQSKTQVPGNAGPLNSSSLVHRSLSLMRSESPAYLQHFLAYIDALAWMEQLTSVGSAPKGRRRKAR